MSSVLPYVDTGHRPYDLFQSYITIFSFRFPGPFVLIFTPSLSRDSPELGIILENGGITSEISLTTVHWESDSGSFGNRDRSVWESVFRQSEMSMKLVIKSEALLDALKSVCETMGGSTIHVSFGQEVCVISYFWTAFYHLQYSGC